MQILTTIGFSEEAYTVHVEAGERITSKLRCLHQTEALLLELHVIYTFPEERTIYTAKQYGNK